eukprot:2182976-Amphidinium_carterae.1
MNKSPFYGLSVLQLQGCNRGAEQMSETQSGCSLLNLGDLEWRTTLLPQQESARLQQVNEDNDVDIASSTPTAMNQTDEPNRQPEAGARSVYSKEPTRKQCKTHSVRV